MLSERLEVRLPRETLSVLRREASERGTSVAELVRDAIELLLHEDRPARLRAAEALFRVGASVADWEVMKREIEKAHIPGEDQ